MGRPPRPVAMEIDPSSIQDQEETRQEQEQEHQGVEESSDPSSISCMILSEISSVLATLRRHHSSHITDDFSDHIHTYSSNNPLLLSFNSLRRALFSPSSSSSSFDPSLLLRPFLDTIRSDHTRAPVTAAALSSLLAILTLSSPLDLRPALPQVVDAVATCRFDVADHASDHAEPVLLNILRVLLECVKPAPDGSVALDDHHVCTAVNTCFRVVHQAGGKTHLLQSSSRDAMHELVRRIFARLPLLPSHSHSPEVQVLTCCLLSFFFPFVAAAL